MGIEPLLCVLVFVAGFALQIVLAIRHALRERLRAGRWMAWHVSQIAGTLGLVEEGGFWRGTVGSDTLELSVARFVPGHLATEIGVHTGYIPRWRRHAIPAAVPCTLVVLKRSRPLPTRLRVTAMGEQQSHMRLGDPVMDQLIRVRTRDAPAARELLRSSVVHDPLIELLGRHPLSVVTHDTIALWLTGEVRSLEPVLELVRELGEALDSLSVVEAPVVVLPRDGEVLADPGAVPAREAQRAARHLLEV